MTNVRIRVGPNDWHRRLMIWMWGSLAPRPTGICAYFWFMVFTLAILPFGLCVKGLAKIGEWVDRAMTRRRSISIQEEARRLTDFQACHYHMVCTYYFQREDPRYVPQSFRQFCHCEAVLEIWRGLHTDWQKRIERVRDEWITWWEEEKKRRKEEEARRQVWKKRVGRVGVVVGKGVGFVLAVAAIGALAAALSYLAYIAIQSFMADFWRNLIILGALIGCPLVLVVGVFLLQWSVTKYRERHPKRSTAGEEERRPSAILEGFKAVWSGICPLITWEDEAQSEQK